jgi:hypothetical protein
MKKIAIFVEGLTEELFLLKLLRELAGEKNYKVEVHQQKKGVLTFKTTKDYGNSNDFEWFILVVNCSSDTQVKSQMLEQYSSMKDAGYSKIIGLKDVHPRKASELEEVRKALHLGFNEDDDFVSLHLSVMETEAWFIQEITHFARLSPLLTKECLANCGFDSTQMTADQIDNPARVLHLIYQTAGLAYRKTQKQILRTVNSLDFDELYFSCGLLLDDLARFIETIEAELFTKPA